MKQKIRKITTEHIESSDFYEKISERVHFLALLESILDSNETVFKYNRKANVYSMIGADYLMKNRVGHESIDITYRYAHLFPTKQTEMADKLDVERMVIISSKSNT